MVYVSRHDWTEKLRLSIGSALVSVSSVSLVTFAKGPRPLSAGRCLGERLDTLPIGWRMYPCHFVPFDRGPKPSCFTRGLN